MPQIMIEVTPKIQARMNDWGRQMKKPPESLALELLEEYFDDCDDADRLEALIQSREMETYSARKVHQELRELTNVGN